VGAEVEFITIMMWHSIDAIRTFAGPDYETDARGATQVFGRMRCEIIS